MKQILTWALIAILSITYAACNKGGDDPDPIEEPEEFVPAFKISGHMYIYSQLRFTSNYTESQRIKFNFGDGVEQSIFGIETTHVYAEPGSYVVLMEVEQDEETKQVTQMITITSGANRMSGDNQWNFFLSRRKAGYPLNHIPPESFQHKMTLDIVDNNTIIVPNIPKMRYPGPHTVTLNEVNEKYMIFRSADSLTELSYDYAAQRGGLKIRQQSNDTTWYMDGFADIYK